MHYNRSVPVALYAVSIFLLMFTWATRLTACPQTSFTWDPEDRANSGAQLQDLRSDPESKTPLDPQPTPILNAFHAYSDQ
jgi:hypothetical protein